MDAVAISEGFLDLVGHKPGLHFISGVGLALRTDNDSIRQPCPKAGHPKA